MSLIYTLWGGYKGFSECIVFNDRIIFFRVFYSLRYVYSKAICMINKMFIHSGCSRWYRCFQTHILMTSLINKLKLEGLGQKSFLIKVSNKCCYMDNQRKIPFFKIMIGYFLQYKNEEILLIKENNIIHYSAIFFSWNFP